MSAPLKKSIFMGWAEEDDCRDTDDVGATEEEIAADVGAADDEDACIISLDDKVTADERTSADESEVNDDEVFSAPSADELGVTTVDEDKIIEEEGETSEELLNSNREASEEDSTNPKLEYCEFSIGVEAGSSPHPKTKAANETQAKLVKDLFRILMPIPMLIRHSETFYGDESSYIFQDDKSIFIKNTSLSSIFKILNCKITI